MLREGLLKVFVVHMYSRKNGVFNSGEKIKFFFVPFA